MRWPKVVWDLWYYIEVMKKMPHGIWTRREHLTKLSSYKGYRCHRLYANSSRMTTNGDFFSIAIFIEVILLGVVADLLAFLVPIEGMILDNGQDDARI